MGLNQQARENVKLEIPSISISAKPVNWSMLGPYKGLDHSFHLALGQADWMTIGQVECSPCGEPATAERNKPLLPTGVGGDSKCGKDSS